MLNCQKYKGDTRKARKGDTLKVSKGSHKEEGCGEVTILVSTTDDRVGDARENVCIHKHQVDLRLNETLQKMFGLEGCSIVRCTGNGHEEPDRKFGADGFIVNGYEPGGKPVFITIDNILMFGSDETTITVLKRRTPVVSTFKVHPRASKVQVRTEVKIIDATTPTSTRMLTSVITGPERESSREFANA